MINSLLIGIGGIVGLMLLWIVIQTLWRRVFKDNISDDDVLSGRTKCANCGCTAVCELNGKKIEQLEIQ